MKKVAILLVLAVAFSGCATSGATGPLVNRQPGEPLLFKALQMTLSGHGNQPRDPHVPSAYDSNIEDNYYRQHPEKPRPASPGKVVGYRHYESTRYGRSESVTTDTGR